MEGFVHWVYAETFSVYEAAYLIMGIDPTTINAEDVSRGQPIIDRMKKSYEHAQRHYSSGAGGYFSSEDELHGRKIELVSVEMDFLLGVSRRSNNDARLIEWLSLGEGLIDLQQFSRDELHRWTAENDLPSKYDFSRQLKMKTGPIENPLSTTERNTLLTIIAALCNYSDIKHQERGVAGKIAEMTDEIGATVTDDTIRKILAKIPDALRTRMK